MYHPVDPLRSPFESDNEWNLRNKFLKTNLNRVPFDRLICLSMCYINHVSYGVTYPPGVMAQLEEMSRGLPSHFDIVKEKNSIAFVKAEVKANNGNDQRSMNDNETINTKPTTSKYSNFVLSTDASFPKTFSEPGAGLGFHSAGSTNDSQSNTSTNYGKMSTKYPGFVKAGSTGAESSKPCFSMPTETFKNMLQFPNNDQSGSNNIPAENPKASSCFNKYTKTGKTMPTANFINSKVYMRSKKPFVKPSQELPTSRPTTTVPKQTLLTTNPAGESSNSQNSSDEFDNVEVTYLEKKFYDLSNNIMATKGKLSAMNPVQVLNMAISKVKLLVTTDISTYPYKASIIFKCLLYIAEVKVGEGIASTKKSAKRDAFSKAITVLTKPTLKVVDLNGLKILVGEQVPRPLMNKMTLKSPKPSPSENNVPKKPISSWGHFLLMQNRASDNAVTLLSSSAIANKMPIEYIYSPDPEGISCTLFINSEPIMQTAGAHKGAAKVAVSEKAVEWLKERCWTIVIKQNADSDDIDVSRDEIMGEIEKQFKPISSDNVGNQLLRKMGWEGGGIGAEGNKGIEDPITVNQVIDRRGLGSRQTSDVSSKFESFVRDTLLNYIKSKKQSDLVFTSEFTKEERAIIHKEARRYNLKSVSRGQRDSRHMIISRKRSPGQLFNHILASGGSTQKYELIPPLNKNL